MIVIFFYSYSCSHDILIFHYLIQVRGKIGDFIMGVVSVFQGRVLDKLSCLLLKDPCNANNFKFKNEVPSL